VELVLVPPGLLHPLCPLPPEAKLLKVTLLVTVVTHKGLRPKLRLRLGLRSWWWRLRLISLGIGGLGFSLGLGLGSPWKEVKRVLDSLRLGNPDWLLKKNLRRLIKDAILRLVGLEGLGVVGLRKVLLRGKLAPLQRLAKHTLEIGLGILVPQTETILFPKLLDHHAQLRLPG